MKKTKMNAEECYCAQDRLSELPNSLIFHILSYLPTTDVVRTTLLSKRWENLWTTITCLDFIDSAMRDRDKFRDFVNGALNSWRGAKISSFTVEFRGDLWNSVTHDDIDSWVLFATEKGVENLKLYLPEPRNQISEYLVPNYLYSCSSLKNIWLARCHLRIDDGNIMVKWDRLKYLRISGKCPSDDAINQVLCGSPKLEFLFLILFSKSNESLISIRSSSLKRLVIFNSQLIDTELRILTPNLRGFVTVGNPYSKFSMMNASSLIEAHFKLFDPNHGRMVAQIIPPFQHVIRIHLTDWCIKALGAMKEVRMPSPFPDAKFLELAFFTQEYEEILGVLEMFPKLKDLVIRTNMTTPQPESEEKRLKFDRNNFPDLFLMHLRTVVVTWTKGDDSIFPLIEFLLKYASNLEKMVIWENKPSKLLLKMERSSPTAEFIFDRAKLYL